MQILVGISYGYRVITFVPPPSPRASLWSSCVVLPLLALTWMSAVLAMTDKRSILFQILFAVFDSLQGFVIVMVHCVLRREVEDDSQAACPYPWSQYRNAERFGVIATRDRH